MNKLALGQMMAQAPPEFSHSASSTQVVVTLPMPDGSLARYSIVDSPIVEPKLAAQIPEVRTFRGQGIDDPTATMRLDWTFAGLHATVLSDSDTVIIAPYAKGDTDNYISYYKKDDTSKGPPFRCFTEEGSVKSLAQTPLPSVVSNGGTLRTYRLAVAATGEYTNVFRLTGDTDAQAKQRALSAIITTVNRINLLFERDLSVRLMLVSNELNIIYTNPSADPYMDGDPNAMFNQNQPNLDSEIGDGNYDIGHVFGSLGGGGIAILNSVCWSGNKARGATSLISPTGDFFAIDYVSHEIGHQFGALHTFNGTGGACGANRHSGGAYEVGAGSTIMAYTYLCFPQDLQAQKNDYYYVSSLEQMLSHINGGGACANQTATGNSPPFVDAGSNFSIPKGTPFTLTATGSDPNGDLVTYTWEEYDLGAPSPPDTDVDGQARPIFRSFLPTTSPSRTFPALNHILNNANVPPQYLNGFLVGESLPVISRTMTFQVTARDNHSGGGISSDSAQVTVDGNSGPFYIVQPNTATLWPVGSAQTIIWNVGNTASSPINCANVKISLSTDGGNTFPTVLAPSTPNDGMESIIVPNLIATAVRVKVEAIGNIFFDISNTNFMISPGSCTYTLSDLSRTLGASQISKNLKITTSGTCSWQAKSNVPWITVPANVFTGTKEFSYTVLANANGATRVGTISVAGQTHTVTQNPDLSSGCVYSLDSSGASYTSVWGTGKFNVLAASNISPTIMCNWTAQSNAPWIVVISGSAGFGNSIVAYTLTPNTGTSSRTGTLTVAGLSFTVTQSGSQAAVAVIAADNSYSAYFNGTALGSGNTWSQAQSYPLSLQTGKNVLAIQGIDAGGPGGLLAEIQAAGQRIGSSVSWKVSTSAPAGWTAVNFNDSSWANATDYGAYGVGPWGANVGGMPPDTPARWIWSSNNDLDDLVYIRVSFNNGTPPQSKINAVSATASATLPGFTPNAVIDGNLNNNWNSGDLAPQWVQIDLGQLYSISKIRLNPSQSPAGNTIHQIYMGSQPQPTMLVTTINEFTQNQQWITHDFAPAVTTVRYVKVLTTSSPSWVSWWEIELYGTP